MPRVYNKKKPNLTKRLNKLEKVVRQRKPEVKQTDVSIASTNITSAGVIVQLTAVGLGNDYNQRIGNSMRVLSINLKGNWSVSGITSAKYYRVAVIMDTQQVSDTAPAISDIFSNAAPQTLFQNVDQRRRFKLLWTSKVYDGTLINSYGRSLLYDKYLKINKTVEFNDGAGTDIQKNGIYVVYLTDDTANTVDANGSSRISFIDP